jgi:hypothetical protein
MSKMFYATELLMANRHAKLRIELKRGSAHRNITGYKISYHREKPLILLENA